MSRSLEWVNEWMNDWTNEGLNEWRIEWVKEWMKNKRVSGSLMNSNHNYHSINIIAQRLQKQSYKAFKKLST